MNMPKELVAILNSLHGHSHHRAGPLDVPLPVPKEHILPVLTLGQKLIDTKGVGKTWASIELWRYVNKIMPYTQWKCCKLDASNSTAPVIEVLGDYRKPIVGKRNVVAVYELPSKHHIRVFELMDLDSQGPLHSYNLWTYVGDVIPQVADNPAGNWRIEPEGDEVLVVLRAPKKNDEDEDDQ